MTVVILAGGIGGARFALGARDVLPTNALTIVGNVGDDLEHWGLAVSPDIDTILYTLAGRVGPLGWGVVEDSRSALGVVSALGGPDWFILGDADVGLHLVRTERLRAGATLSSVVEDVGRRWRVGATILPATDDRLRTVIVTADGEVGFQEWFVGRRAAPPVVALRLDGVAEARPAPGVLEAIGAARRIVLAPSNPFLSLDPILAVEGIRASIAARRDDVVAVSPIIAGRAVKGPLGEMLDSLGHERSALGVARYLAPLCGTFVLDEADRDLAGAVEALGMRAIVTATLMVDDATRRALARAVLEG